ncbi:MAG: flagellin, partial [Phycisphaerae bacterium]
GDPLDETQRAEWTAAAELISGIIDQVLTVANRQFQGVYLFGGRASTQPPFAQEQGGVVFQGDSESMQLRLDEFDEVAFGVAGDEVFGALSAEVKGWRDLSPALAADTRLVDLNGAVGQGVRLGTIQIDDSSIGTAFELDLSAADNVGDVVDAINDALSSRGSATTVAVGVNGIEITVPAGVTVAISEVGGGLTATDLGIAGTYSAGGSATVFYGADVDPRLTLTTPLTALCDGAGVALSGGLLISNGQLSATVDFSGASTVQDVLNAINNAGVAVLARINQAGTGIDVVNRLSGSELRIGENGAAAAEELGIRSLHAGTLLSELDGGRGVQAVEGADFRVYCSDNSVYFDVDISGARTLQDVIDAINTAAAGAGLSVGTVPPGEFLADLAATGNGIRLTDNLGGSDQLRVERLNLSPAIDGLGLSGKVGAGSGPVSLVGDDTHGIVPDGVFSALYRLREGLLDGDRGTVTAAGQRLGELMRQVNRWQGLVGARSQAMQARLQRTEDAVDATRILLSELKDVDFAEAVTRFQQAQTALQANLLSGGQILNVSLLDFLR